VEQQLLSMAKPDYPVMAMCIPSFASWPPENLTTLTPGRPVRASPISGKR